MKKKWTLKKIMYEIGTILLILFVVSMVLNYIRKPDINEDIYRLELSDIHDNKINLHEYQQKPLLVHFWATWCPTCKVEASNIESISSTHNVISIAVKSGSNEDLMAFMKEKGLSYKVINDKDGMLAKRFDIGAYPTTLIYNGEGELKFTEVGYSTTLGLKARLGLVK